MFAHIVGYSSRDRRPGRRRALGQRLPRRRAHRSRRRARERAPLAGGRRGRSATTSQLSLIPAAQRAAMSALAATRQARRRVRDRAAHRPRARERVVAELRPEPRRAGLAAGHGQRARQPRDAGPVSAGLVDQARDRRARARERARTRPRASSPTPATSSSTARRSCNDSGERLRPASNLTIALTHSINSVFAQPRRRALRRPRALPGADRGAAEARLLLDPAARLPDRSARGLRHGALGHQQAGLPERADRPGAHGDRPGQSRRHADADGDGRRRVRERRRRDAADARRSRALARRRAPLRAAQRAAQPRRSASGRRPR